MVSFKQGAGKGAAGRLTGRSCCWWPPCSLGAAGSESPSVHRRDIAVMAHMPSLAGSCIAVVLAIPSPAGSGVSLPSQGFPWAQERSLQAELMAKAAVCSACSPAARSLVWRQRASIQPACPARLSWCVAQGWKALSLTWTCPPTCRHVLTPILLLARAFSSVTCVLHCFAEAMGEVGQN